MIFVFLHPLRRIRRKDKFITDAKWVHYRINLPDKLVKGYSVNKITG